MSSRSITALTSAFTLACSLFRTAVSPCSAGGRTAPPFFAKGPSDLSRNAPFTRPVDISDAAEVGKVADLFQRHLGAQAGATQAAAIGIFPHHANVPHGLRLSIEHAMKEGLAKFVICTSTLAQGVNFPLKYLIVTTTQQGQERIMVRDFHNLMGRAGRAGMHTEGSVIFSSPEVYDQRENVRYRALALATSEEPA